MMEVIIVLVLVAILFALAIGTFQDTRSTTAAKRVQEVAAAYGEAVAAFQRDHAGRSPAFGGADWPVAEEGPVPGFDNGQRERYLRDGIPAIVEQEGVLVGSNAAGTANQGGIVYRRVGARGYRIDAFVAGELICSVGSEVPSEQRCR